MRLDDEKYIRKAIEIAQHARDTGNHPFGALLVDDEGQVLLEAENTVITEKDITGHAETNLIRQASEKFTSEFLARCSLYTSTEPCAMCAAAIYWSNVRRVVFGLRSEILSQLVDQDSEEVLDLPCSELFERGPKQIEIVGPVLEEEATQVHAGFWQ